MSALEKLKSILPSEDQEEKSGDLEDLSSLKEYVNLSKAHSDSMPQLLESIRVDMFSRYSKGESMVNGISDAEFNKFFLQFENYKSNIRHHREKLVPVKTILKNFNNELVQLSENLIELQNKSSQLSSDVGMQSDIAKKLNPIIIDLMIPPEIVKSIMSDPVTPSWLENIRFINEKLQLISNVRESKVKDEVTSSYRNFQSFNQLADGIELMKDKAIERIRDYIISQIKLLRSQTTLVSSQNIQKTLLEVKDIYIFLLTHHRDLASQLQVAYTYTMRWYYHTRFAKYIYTLQKISVRHVDHSIVIGSDSTEEKQSLFGSKYWLGSGSNALHPPAPSNGTNASQQVPSISDYLLSVDRRIQILDGRYSQSPSAIPSQIAETTPFSYWLEFIFKHWLLALVDNIVVEYLFVVDFFFQGDEKIRGMNTKTQDSEKEKEWPEIMFSEVFKMGKEFVVHLVTSIPSNASRISSSLAKRNVPSHMLAGSCDSFAILLIIRMIQDTFSTLHNEFHVPIMDDYLNSVLQILWPHFTKIIDLNSESLKKFSTHATVESKLAPVSVTQHFGQFISGLLKLATVRSKDKKEVKGEPLYISIDRLSNDFESTLTKLSNNIFGSGRGKTTEKEIFLYNNYFLVVNILRNENGDASNDFIQEKIKHFETLCDAYKK